MPYKDGRLYIDTSTTPPKGISLLDIAKCIGVGSQDLGTLASHKNNNKWSWHKPVRSKEKGILPHEAFASEDISFGFDITRIYGQGLKQLMDNAQVDRDWIYLRPQGGINSNPFRTLTDYDGYNHRAVCPYRLEDNPTSFTSYAPLKGGFNMTFAINRNPDAEIQITDMAILTGSNGQQLSSWKYGIAYRESANAPIYMALGSPIANEDERIYIEVPFNGAGSYQMCFVATTEAAGDTSGAALYSLVLPKGYTTFTLEYKKIPVDFDVSGFNASAVNAYRTNEGIIIRGTAVFDWWSKFIVRKPEEAGNVGISESSAKLTLKFYAYDSDGNQFEQLDIPFEEALYFNPNSQQYDPEKMEESFYTNFSVVLGDNINLGDFGGKTSRAAYLKLSFECVEVYSESSNTYIRTYGEPMGGFTINIID